MCHTATHRPDLTLNDPCPSACSHTVFSATHSDAEALLLYKEALPPRPRGRAKGVRPPVVTPHVPPAPARKSLLRCRRGPPPSPVDLLQKTWPEPTDSARTRRTGACLLSRAPAATAACPLTECLLKERRWTPGAGDPPSGSGRRRLTLQSTGWSLDLKLRGKNLATHIRVLTNRCMTTLCLTVSTLCIRYLIHLLQK